MADRVVLVDGSALIYRAFFALPSSFRTSTGIPTNATYGFALMFKKIFAGKTPRYAAVVFDAPGGTFRDEIYPDYKVQRPRMAPELRAQLEWIDKVVGVHAFPILRLPGFEADDVIGTITRRAVAAGHEVHIISGDKDFAQLIGPKVRMIDTMRDITYDEELVRKKWGVRPEHFTDLLALLGDKVDNIPGVPGVGQKGAARLIAEHGDVDTILAAAAGMKGRAAKALLEHADLARLSKRLATIATDAPVDTPLEALAIQEPDPDALNTLYRELEFYSLLSEDAVAQSQANDTTTEVLDRAAVLDFVAAPPSTPVALHAVFEDPGFKVGELHGLALGIDTGAALYVPGEYLDLLAPWLGSSASKVVHGVRDLICGLDRLGVELHGVVSDTQCASFLVDPTGLIPHRLDQVGRQYLQRVLPADDKGVVGAGQKRRRFAEVDVQITADWSGLLAAATLDLWTPLERALDEQGQRENHDALCLPMAAVLARMQSVGVRVDTDVLARLQEEFTERRDALCAEVHGLAGRVFNLGSTKQLGEVLFDDLGLPVIKRTKTGYSTAADVLERLAPHHEIARLVLDWRVVEKLINTYTRVLQEAVNPRTGRLHATFMQTTGATGRIITTDPDLQRTPIRTPDGARIREAFLPRDGWTMISADWSQIELRILAHFSRDPLLLEAFRDDLDIHARTAGRIFDVSPDEVTREQRNVGKTVNFATIYGQGATALGQQLGLKRAEAKKMIARYFEVYAGVRRWLDEAVADAYDNGWCASVLGRRRHVTELTSNNFTQRSYGERIAANTPIQGTAADLCKLAMLAIDGELTERGLQTRMLVQIHDELLFEAPPEEVEDACELIRRHMEGVWPLLVPLKVDVGTGGSWAEAH